MSQDDIYQAYSAARQCIEQSHSLIRHSRFLAEGTGKAPSGLTLRSVCDYAAGAQTAATALEDLRTAHLVRHIDNKYKNVSSHQSGVNYLSGALNQARMTLQMLEKLLLQAAKKSKDKDKALPTLIRKYLPEVATEFVNCCSFDHDSALKALAAEYTLLTKDSPD